MPRVARQCHPPAIVPTLEADPLAVLAAAGVVPVVSVEDAATAVTLSRLLVEHGLPVVEITFRTDAARAAIAAVAAAVPEITIVAGTVLTPVQAEEAVTAGAHLLVAPGTNPNVVRRAAELGVPMLPASARRPTSRPRSSWA